MNGVLEVYSQLIRMKNRNLSEQTYVGLVEICMRNGHLNHASYFLCQMDRNKINIPRKLLDMFLDYSISKHYFDKQREEIVFENKDFDRKKVVNKFDDFDPNVDPDYNYYSNKRYQFKNRKDELKNVFSKLRLDAKPYVPKKIDQGNERKEDDNAKTPLSAIDPTKIKEFIPKNYKVVKKE